MADPYRSVVTTLSNQYVLSLWSLKDDDYPTYDDRRLGAHGVQKQQGGGEEQQQEEEDAAKDSRVFDTDEVWQPPYRTSDLFVAIDLFIFVCICYWNPAVSNSFSS